MLQTTSSSEVLPFEYVSMSDAAILERAGGVEEDLDDDTAIAVREFLG
jgi:hypothetical protein